MSMNDFRTSVATFPGKPEEPETDSDVFKESGVGHVIKVISKVTKKSAIAKNLLLDTKAIPTIIPLPPG
jgi:hypothetical protein